MDETYRMLGKEHETDLEREAARRALRALLPAKAPLTKRAADSLRRITTRLQVLIPRLGRGEAVCGTAAGNDRSATQTKPMS